MLVTHPLVEFLHARLDEDEQAACHAGPADGDSALYILDDDYKHNTIVITPARLLGEIETKRRLIELHPHTTMRQEIGEERLRLSYGPHWETRLTSVDTPYCQTCHVDDGVIEHDDGRPCLTLRLLARPHDSDPNYREEWRP